MGNGLLKKGGLKVKFLMSIFLFLSSCVSKPKCGNPEGAKIIFEDEKSCRVRIRQVVIGSDFKIPEGFKSPALVGYEMNWRDTFVENGKVVMGHFILVPKNSGQPNEN